MGSVLKSRFDHKLCCDHKWQRDMHQRETCARCGTWCQRDAECLIVGYSAYGADREVDGAQL